jgi:hypothetical protein
MPEEPAPVPFEIFSGENLMIQVPLYVLDVGLTWKGRYDPTALYVVDDALLGEDNIGYKVIADVGPGVPPPNATFYTALDPVPVSSIASITMQLVQNNQNVVSWQYNRVAKIAAAPLIVGQKYLIYDFHAGDDFANVGASSNAAGVIFTATGDTPTTWTNGTILYQVQFPPNFTLADGLFQAELLAADTVARSGLFELRITIASEAEMYIASGAQSDVLCIEEAIKITPC